MWDQRKKMRGDDATLCLGAEGSPRAFSNLRLAACLEPVVLAAGRFRVHLREFQQRIEEIYGSRDRRRGRDGTFRWLVEEVGELARAMRDDNPDALRVEIADVLAWTASVASLCGVDVEQAATRYAHVCPKCRQAPCSCAVM